MSWQTWMAYGIGILAALGTAATGIVFATDLLVAVGIAALLFGVYRSVIDRPEAMIREIFTVIALALFVLSMLYAHVPYFGDANEPPAPACPALERIPGDCTDAVNIAVAATQHHCANVFDCVNEGRHPDTCTADCKYCALRRALDLEEIP